MSDHILSAIEQANGFEIDEITNAIIKRYRKLFPDWEIIFLSLPRNDPAERRQTIEAAMALLQKQPQKRLPIARESFVLSRDSIRPCRRSPGR